MGNLRLPKIIMSEELDKTGKHGPEGKENNWTDCLAKDCRLFGITGGWSAFALDPGAWYNALC